MKKRLLSGLLSAVLTLSLLASPVSAAQIPTVEDAALVMAALHVMQGDESGDLMLSRTITRAEFVKMAVMASTKRENVGTLATVSPYPDVPASHWSAPYILAAQELGLVKGNIYGYFEPNRTITLAESVTILLRLLGYPDSQFTSAYPAGQMSQYLALELYHGVPTQDPATPITRLDALYLFYNLMTAHSVAQGVAGTYMIDFIEPGLVKADGTVDLLALVNRTMDGPVVATSQWQTQVPLDMTTAEVFLDGKSAVAADILTHHVLYWSTALNTLWAYSGQIFGVIDAISPTSNPTSVTISGATYPIGTTDASLALSDLGTFQVGDLALLLLGRDNQVVSVVEPGSARYLQHGIVTAVASLPHTDALGETTYAQTISLLSTDGQTRQYRWDEDSFEVGDLIQAQAVNGAIVLAHLSHQALSGDVDDQGTQLGDIPFAPDIEILDVYEDGGQGIAVEPRRLANVTLTKDDVQYYERNAAGAITRLILDDVTGDNHQYGVATKVVEEDSAFSLGFSNVYTYDLRGNSIQQMETTRKLGLEKGPLQLSQELDKQPKLHNLTEEVTLTALTGYTAYDGATAYPISESVAVYELRDGDYYYTTLPQVNTADFTLTGYLDKPVDEGGTIRVLLSENKA